MGGDRHDRGLVNGAAGPPANRPAPGRTERHGAPRYTSPRPGSAGLNPGRSGTGATPLQPSGAAGLKPQHRPPGRRGLLFLAGVAALAGTGLWTGVSVWWSLVGLCLAVQAAAADTLLRTFRAAPPALETGEETYRPSIANLLRHVVITGTVMGTTGLALSLFTPF